jgi:hypothetical protein
MSFPVNKTARRAPAASHGKQMPRAPGAAIAHALRSAPSPAQAAPQPMRGGPSVPMQPDLSGPSPQPPIQPYKPRGGRGPDGASHYAGPQERELGV